MSAKWGQICGDVTTSPESSVHLAILNREPGLLWVNIVLWDTLDSCKTNPFLNDQRLINSKGWEKEPWKFLVLAFPLPLTPLECLRTSRKSSKSTAWAAEEFSRGPLDWIAFEFIVAMISSLLTSLYQRARVTQDLFPIDWKENIYEQPQFCKGDCYDKNGIEARGCVLHDGWFLKSLRMIYLRILFLKNDALVPAFLYFPPKRFNHFSTFWALLTIFENWNF